ncbi:copper amine oxidase N-terminal domain-containing protein [Pelotomaculum terephthalicicum JT]|uniref:copper amine oxidase N-terminal domain-containing protein n=1 Tax=Pelotomaculum terephthalicicum TaxID=206393 RepID=UPI0009C93321|nr:copper amine oxidase N-terminal domain-containing protein [Pelotomaculum terephthalicicum]MCG9966758.1 copper amine oxidase N-terminal domain-containing protein [Pelotomaculum terephthalicicum JT]OPY60327.1 MAG: hypothetical protein A4E56_02753 [Pelotomaculum sp. PtaU1.Bin065]
MRRKFIVVLAFTLLIISAAFPAFAAETVQLQVNGDTVPTPGLYMTDDCSMVPVDTFISIVGADVNWSANDNFAVTENGVTLNLTVGKTEALLGDKTITLPVAPAKTGDSIFIPLRAVSNAFGFTVDWDGEQWLIKLTRNEQRNGMSVSDLLTKSTVASQVYNTYSMEGLFNIDMDIQEDGKAVEQAPKNVTSKLTGQIQNDPFQVYMKQTVVPEAADNNTEAIDEAIVETYMNQDKMYIKAPGQDWTVMDMPFSPEFWKQQQDIQSDPLKAAELMKEMGILLNFGNDMTIANKDYYVVNATIDMNKFMQGYPKIIAQAMQGVPQGTASGNPADLQKQMEELLKNATLDYNYSVLINKETMLSEIVKYDARLIMSFENPVSEEANGAEKDNAPKVMKIDMKLTGDINITDMGGAFNAPDVSAAKETSNP